MKIFDEDAWIKQAALEEDGAFVGAGRIAPTKSPGPFVAVAHKRPLKVLRGKLPQAFALAADTDAPAEVVVLIAEHDEPVARLFYEYQGATLNLEFLHTVAFAEFDAEIELTNGKHLLANQLTIKEHKATLLIKTALTEDDIARVRISPRDLASPSRPE